MYKQFRNIFGQWLAQSAQNKYADGKLIAFGSRIWRKNKSIIEKANKKFRFLKLSASKDLNEHPD